MITSHTEDLDIHFPLTKKLVEEKITLSKAAKNIGRKFLSLSRDLSPKELENNLQNLFLECKNLVPSKQKKNTSGDISKLQQEHERYFFITRYEDNVGNLIVENIIQSYLRFLSDYQRGSHLTLIDLGHIDSALKSFMQYLL